MKKKRAEQRNPPADKGMTLLRAAADYLESKGWSVLVGSIDRIQQWPGEPAFNYELVIKFTGSKKTEPAKDSAQ